MSLDSPLFMASEIKFLLKNKKKEDICFVTYAKVVFLTIAFPVLRRL